MADKIEKRGGYTSGDKPVADLKPPPGPGPGYKPSDSKPSQDGDRPKPDGTPSSPDQR